MRHVPVWLYALLVASVLVMPGALAQGEAPPEDAQPADVGDLTVRVWFENQNGTATFDAAAGENVTFHAHYRNGGAVNWTVSESLVAANATVATAAVTAGPSILAPGDTAEHVWSVAIPADYAGEREIFQLTIDAVEDPDGAATRHGGPLPVEIIIQPAPVVDDPGPDVPGPGPGPDGNPVDLTPGPSGRVPTVLIVAVVLAAGGGTYVLIKRRRVKPKPRSQTLKRMEMEQKAERAKTPEQKAVIQAEIKETEAERSRARDLQILKAKRQDAEKMIGLLQKRHDAGQITELQFNKMVERKQADIARFDGEIASFDE